MDVKAEVLDPDVPLSHIMHVESRDADAGPALGLGTQAASGAATLAGTEAACRRRILEHSV